jgi:transcriptional regulator GlxA family with amidase domain
MRRSARPVVLLAFEGAQLLDIAGPLQVFATANEEAGGSEAPYRLSVVSAAGGPIGTSSGLAVVGAGLSAAARAIHTLIVAGGPGVAAACRDRRQVAWLAGASKRARRTCSVCTGAFLLAEAGLLAGRRATTHWSACAELAARHPAIDVVPDAIFVQDGAVWSSAGVTAGIDLALALVEADLGRALAMRVARRLVVFLKRPGGQSQFSALLDAQAADDDFAALHEWIAANLAGDLSVERLAERAAMSPRNFARVYAAKLGTTPAKAVEAMRVEAARRSLEDSDRQIEQIARRCGFGDEETMRRAFRRRLGVNPRDYRRRFAA